MSMVIQHNIPALQTYNIVNSTSNALQKSIAKLSSGLRINSAADDAAGLAISEKMRAQVRGLDRAVSNTQDGISLIQTAEGALQETHSILQRMRELAVQGANDTLTQQDRTYIQEEIDQLKDEITRIGNTTQFNKKKLLNGESSALWSSSDMETKALVRGSLREVDQFGQKKSIEGNYKIRVKAEPGQAEVQKSDIMTIKHPDVLTNKTVKADDGIKDVSVDNMTPGTYSLQLTDDETTNQNTGQITGSYGVGGSSGGNSEFTGVYTAGSNAMVRDPIAANGSETFKIKLGDKEFSLDVESTGATMTASDVAKDLASQMTEKLAGFGVTVDEEELADFLTANDGKTTLKATAASKNALGDLSVASSNATQYSKTISSGANPLISAGVGANSSIGYLVDYGSAGGLGQKLYTVTNDTATGLSAGVTADKLAEQMAKDLGDIGVQIDADKLGDVLSAANTSVVATASGPGIIPGTGTMTISIDGTASTGTALTFGNETNTSYTTQYTKGTEPLVTGTPGAGQAWSVKLGSTDLSLATTETTTAITIDAVAGLIADKAATAGFVIDSGELSAFLSDTTGDATLNISSATSANPGTLTIVANSATGGVAHAVVEPGETVSSTKATSSAVVADSSAKTTYTSDTTDWTTGFTAGNTYELSVGDTNVSVATVATDTADDLVRKLVSKAAENGLVIDGDELKDFMTDTTGTKTLTIGSSVAKSGEDITFKNSTSSTQVGTASAGNVEGASTEAKASDIFEVTSTGNNTMNASILFEVTGKNEAADSVTLKATATMLDQNGKASSATMDNIVVTGGGDEVNLTGIFGGDNDNDQRVTVRLNAGYLNSINKGGMFVASVKAGTADANNGNGITVKLNSTKDKDWANAWDNGVFNEKTPEYFLNGEELADKDINFTNYILNEKTGEVSQGTVTLSTDKTFSKNGTLAKNASIKNNDVLANFTTTYIGKTATGDVKLRDLDKFWNSEGTFMLDDAKTLTLNQGDGKTASITLYANDTLDEVATKINNAIADGLGQATYVDNATHFATFVSDASGEFDSQAVNGTFVIRSVVPGAQGEITFSGDENVLNALSLNTIQDSKETVYNVDVLDEHTGKLIAQNVKTTSNVMYGVIHDNVDVEFGALSGVSATWNENMNKYTYDTETTESTLHIADNTTVLQIGANEGEDLAMDIGDMRSHALGIDGVNVMSHDRAGRAITLIDNAIDKVSTQRAKLGAYQNRLEYTASSLTTASENLTSAESRIRDADMAKEMMEFTKLNIMLQAGNSMLAQANQQPQNVLSLIR